MIYLVALVVLILANARAARLASKDDLTAPIRHWIDRRFGDNSFAARLMWCPWCTGVWTAGMLSAVAMGVAWAWDGWPFRLVVVAWLPVALAIGYGGSRLVDMEGD